MSKQGAFLLIAAALLAAANLQAADFDADTDGF